MGGFGGGVGAARAVWEAPRGEWVPPKPRGRIPEGSEWGWSVEGGGGTRVRVKSVQGIYSNNL